MDGEDEVGGAVLDLHLHGPDVEVGVVQVGVVAEQGRPLADREELLALAQGPGNYKKKDYYIWEKISFPIDNLDSSSFLEYSP